MHADDMALVREFARSGSEQAFATLVERHINLVYSAALRRLGNPHEADEVTQAVFIILARKAGRLRSGTILSGWLYQTAQLTAANFRRAALRRRRQEQEACLQFSQESEPDKSWERWSPILEDGMARLGAKDRDAILLRFFENRTAREVASALGVREEAAQKRLARAIQKLRGYFARQGVQVSPSLLLSAIGNNAVDAAPSALAPKIVAMAAVKTATASSSTLTLIKSTLKVMAWTKAKTVAVIGVGLLIAGGTATVAVKEVRQKTLARDMQDFDAAWADGISPVEILDRVPPQTSIVPTRFSRSKNFQYGMSMVGTGGRLTGVNQSLETILINTASAATRNSIWTSARMVFLTALPPGRYDYIANLPLDSAESMFERIQRQFGVTARLETRNTDVLELRVANPNAPGLKPSALKHPVFKNVSPGHFVVKGMTLSYLALPFLEDNFGVPVLDRTELRGSYDIDLHASLTHYEPDERRPNPDDLKQAILDQLGLRLISTNEPVKTLVVAKAE